MNDESNKQRYAFIDVQNTDSTTRQLLGFAIDWHRLHVYLKDHWQCEKVFFYSGIHENDLAVKQEFDRIACEGAYVKLRPISRYKNHDKHIRGSCDTCKKSIHTVVDMGYRQKANCDVDLTVDAMDAVSKGSECFLFTGDGDFDYLVQKMVERGVKVYIVASDIRVQVAGGYRQRFSARLKDTIKMYPHGKVNLIDIDSWKMKIQKQIATKRDDLRRTQKG